MSCLTCTARPFVRFDDTGKSHPLADSIEVLLCGHFAVLHQQGPDHRQPLLLQDVHCVMFVESLSEKLTP